MHHRLLLLAAATAATLAGGAAHAAVVTLDFDEPVSTDITNAYAGLTFRAPLGGTGPVRTWATPGAHSGANQLGLSGQNNFYAFNQGNGAIDIIFDTAVSSVSIAAAFLVATDQFLGIGGLPFMAAYSSDVISSANRIGLDSWDIAGDSCLGGNFCTSGWDLLSISSGSANIKAVRLTGSLASSGGVSRLAMFDTLSYTTGDGGGGGGGGTVPEPASLALCLVALAGAGAASRARTQAARKGA